MRFKDMINPKKWVHYGRFLLRKIAGKLAKEAGYRTPEDMAWQAEVIVFRGLMCGRCKEEGKCVGIEEGQTEPCGCDWIGKSTDMSLSCNLKNWPAVKDKEDWEDQKGKYMHGLTFGLVGK
jgi:hypothetical protein